MQIPETDALRILAHGNARDMYAAQLETLQAQAQLLIARRDAAHAKARAVMERHGLDPDAHAVVTQDGGPFPFRTVIDVKTGQPLQSRPPAEAEQAS